MEVENANCKLKVSQCLDMEIFPIERPLKMDCEINGLEKLVSEIYRVFSKDHVNVHEVHKIMASYSSNPKHWKKYAKFDRYRYTRNLVDAGNGAFNIMILCWGPGHASAIHDHADSHCFMKLLSGSLEEVRFDWPKTVEPEVMKKLKNRRRCCSESGDLRPENGDVCQNDMCQNFGGKIDENDNCESDVYRNDDHRLDEKHKKLCDQNGNVEKNVYEGQKMVETGRTRMNINDVCYINDAIGLHRMENPSHVDGAVSLHLYCPPFDSCRVFDALTGKPTQVKVTFTSVYGKRAKHIEENNVADSQ